MSPVTPSPVDCQPVLCSDAESLEGLVKSQQEQIVTQREQIRSQQQTIQSQQGQIATRQQTIEGLEEHIKSNQERITQLTVDLRAQKRLKGKTKLRASQLNAPKPKAKGKGKRPGSAKRSKTSGFKIDEEKIIQPDEIPAGIRFQWLTRL